MPVIRTVRSNVSSRNTDGRSALQGGGLGTEPSLLGIDDGDFYDDKYAEATNFQDTISQYYSDGMMRSFGDYYANSSRPDQPFNMGDVANTIAATSANPSGRAPSNKPSWAANTAPVDPSGNYTPEQTQQIVDLLKSGNATAQEVADYYGVDPQVVQENLDYINRTHHTPDSVAGGAGNDQMDDARDPNVIIDDAARDGTTIEDLIDKFKDKDGNPYSIAEVIGALILSGNKNAETVLSNSGYNPDGTPKGGAGAGTGNGADPGANSGTGNGADPGADPDPDDDTCQIVDGVQYVKNENGECVAPAVNVDDTNDDTGGSLIPDIIEGGATAAALGGAMSGFSSGFSNTEKTTSTMDPDIKNRLTDLYGPTPGVINSLVNRLNTGYGGYTGDRYGDMNEDQLRFNEMIRNNIENIPGKSIFDKAVTRADSTATPTGMDVAKTAFGPTDQPLATAARENIKDVVAGQFAGTNLDPYQNPYNNAVIDTALADLDRATQMRLRTADDQATKAGAYGGDRAAIERGLIGEESLRTAGRMVADLRARGFEDAANRVEADLDRNLKAQEANQLADRQTSRDALDTATAIERDDPLNQLRTAEALINAFSTGSDQYRNALGDFMSVGDRLDARDQREKDFQFAEFLASIGYDQDMINNMINLLSTATGDREEETKTEMGTIGQIGQVAELIPAIKAAGGEIYKDGKWFWED